MQRDESGRSPLFSRAAEGNRIIDLRFTNQWKGIVQVIEDLGNPFIHTETVRMTYPTVLPYFASL